MVSDGHRFKIRRKNRGLMQTNFLKKKQQIAPLGKVEIDDPVLFFFSTHRIDGHI